MESAECAGVDALLILYLSGSYQQATTVAQSVLDEHLPGIKEFAMLLDVLMEAENSAASKGAVNAYVQMFPGSKMHTFAGRYFVRWLYAHENLRKNVAGRMPVDRVQDSQRCHLCSGINTKGSVWENPGTALCILASNYIYVFRFRSQISVYSST